MANQDSRKLQVDVVARISSLERQMAKAAKVTDTNMRKVETRAAAMVSKVNSHFATFGKGLLAGVAAGGIAGIVTQVGQVAKGIASIGDEAKRAGVSAEAFQEWKFVAEQNRIGIDAMTDGLKELNLRADEFIQTGSGPAAEAFQRLGYGAQELTTKLKDPSALLLEIIGRLGQMDKAAQIRISDELFGGSAGERFVELLAQGEKGIRDTISRAHELGIVMDDKLIQKAADLDRRFNEVANTVGTALKSAIVSAADSLAEFIDGFRAFENQQNSTLANKVIEIDKERLDLENQILDVRRKQDEETGTYAEYERKLLDGQISALEDQRKALADEAARIEAILSGRSTAAMARSGDRTWTPPTPPPGGFGSVKSGSSKKDTFKGERDAFADLIGYTEEYRRQQELANQQLEAFGDLPVDAGTSLVNMFADGKVEAGELLGVITNIAQQLLRMPGLAGLLGGLFGGGGFSPTAGGFASMLGIPGYANGTNNHPGGLAIVGERGPELLNLPRGAQVMPRVPKAVGMSGGGQPSEIRVVVETNDPMFKARVTTISRGQAQQVTASGLKAYDAGKRRQQLTNG